MEVQICRRGGENRWAEKRAASKNQQATIQPTTQAKSSKQTQEKTKHLVKNGGGKGKRKRKKRNKNKKRTSGRSHALPRAQTRWPYHNGRHKCRRLRCSLGPALFCLARPFYPEPLASGSTAVPPFCFLISIFFLLLFRGWCRFFLVFYFVFTSFLFYPLPFIFGRPSSLDLLPSRDKKKRWCFFFWWTICHARHFGLSTSRLAS